MLRLSPPEHWPELVRHRSEVLELGKGKLLFQEGELATHLCFLQHGHVRLFRVTAQDREVTLFVAGPGQWLSESSLGGSEQQVFAETLDSVLMLQVPVKDLQQAALQDLNLARFLMQVVTSQIEVLQRQHQHLVFHDVGQRLATALLRLAAEGHGLSGKLSHQDLAFMVGSTRETITKLLGEFRDLGLLELGYRKIGLLDEEGLRRLSMHRHS